MKILSLRRIYATLVQLEWVMAIAAGYLMGAQKWALALICGVLTLLLGFITNELYWYLMDKINEANQ